MITSAPVTFPGARLSTCCSPHRLAAAGYVLAIAQPAGLSRSWLWRRLRFGVLMVMPIGGADMPVVISLLNAFTGTAVAMAGFVIGNWALIIAGALVGASGGS